MGFLDNTGLERLWMHIISKLGEKVNKEDGKGLSANDYTTEEKTKLANLSSVAVSGNYNDLVNKPTIPSIEGLATELYVDDAIAAIPIPDVTEQINAAINGLATETYVNTKVNSLVDSAPETLNTLNELAAALGEDPNFATTVATEIGKKADKTTIDEAISTHNTDGTAHQDIRAAIYAARDGIVLKDQVNGYNYVLCMRDGELVTYCATESIEVTTMPTKTSYMVGDVFDTTGMVVTATAYNRTTKEVTDITASTEPLAETTKEVEVNYTEAGIVHSTGVPVSVREFDPAIDLVDFEYTDNGDGTYTLTAWKGTYQGEPSTELIVPNSSAVIV